MNWKVSQQVLTTIIVPYTLFLFSFKKTNYLIFKMKKDLPFIAYLIVSEPPFHTARI